ncbi:MAG: FitA-like ribbon-helix-helix domain-containing protein [Terriglobales bacterium]
MAATTMVQIRNVPKELHRRLKARAAMEGMSMSDYAMRELRKSLEVPTRQEILERLAQPRTRLKLSTVDILRQDRESH